MRYRRELFTSELIIVSNPISGIDSIINELSDRITPYSKFSDNNVLRDMDMVNDFIDEITDSTDTPRDLIVNFINYSSVIDFTGLLKGYFIHLLDKELSSSGKYLINFGGDILARNSPTVKVMNRDQVGLPIILSGDFICFTSGNNYKRGNHIVSKDGSFNKLSSTVVTKIMNPVLADIVSTRSVSEYPFNYDGFDIYINKVE